MMGDDEDAKRLARLTCSLGEFLMHEAADWPAPRLARRALVHLHCHARATAGTDCDLEVLDRLGVEHSEPEAACCGLAGSFGYEAGEKYEVSVRAGERVLLPAVRAASPDTLVIADGFSCRSQIAHGTDRTALHLAQVVRLALEGDGAVPHRHPELSVAGTARGGGAS